MMTAVLAHFDPAIVSLTALVAGDAPVVSGSAAAFDLIDSVERVRRLAAVAAVDVLEQIQLSRAFYEQGHANARIMFAHRADVSGAEAHRLDKIRRMVNVCDDINQLWRAGNLSVDKAGLLGRAFANPRTRARFMLDQQYFLKHARKLSLSKFERKIADWLELHDCDGPDPAPDPSHERRDLKVSQDYFSKAWKIEGTLGSQEGSLFNVLV